MGSTNLRTSLETKMGHWAAEAQEHAREIARIESLFERLDGLRERAERLEHVLECAGVVMKEINPDWSVDQLKPIKKNVHKGPGRPGEIARYALDILRDAPEALPTRDIAVEVLVRLGHVDPDDATIQKIVNAVHASLCAKEREGLVEHNSEYGRKWRISV